MKTMFQGKFSPPGGGVASMGQFSAMLPYGLTTDPVVNSTSAGFDWSSLIKPVVTTGISIYQQERAEEAAEEAAEAQAELLRQQIEANQAAAAEAERLRQEGGPEAGTILGIPANILYLAGAGVGILALVLILTKK